MITPTLLREIKARKPAANEMLKGYFAAETGLEYTRLASEDWRLGYLAWVREHGDRRSSNAWH